MIELSENQQCIFIKGNHDVWCEDWLARGEGPGVWLSNGGKSTVDSYENYSQEDQEIHLEFFQRMKSYHVDDHNRLFIHAGYSSMHGPEKEVYSSNYRWDRTLWETAVAMDKKLAKNSLLYPKRLLLYKEIFIGHTPTLYIGSKTLSTKPISGIWIPGQPLQEPYPSWILIPMNSGKAIRFHPYTLQKKDGMVIC